MHAYQHVFAVAEIATHERHVFAFVVGARVTNRSEVAIAQWNPCPRTALDQAVEAPPVRDEIGDRDHDEAMRIGERAEFFGARHRRRIDFTHDLTNGADGPEA